MKVRLALATLVTAGAAVVLPAAAAHADTPCQSTLYVSCPVAPVVGTGGFVAPAVQGTQGGPAALASTSSAALPLTGGDVAGLSFIGLGLLGAGTVLVRRGRVRTADTKD